jgi:lantibiotic modifying enzyme
MLAALAAGEDDLFRSSAAWLLAERGDDGLWEQDMYGSRERYVGAGHGFAGNVHALLRGRALLDPAVADDIERSAVDVLTRLAERDGSLVRWPSTPCERLAPDQLRVQWCHGSPGIVIALGAVLGRDDAVDALLLGGGELTWTAGPLRANASLCHGTAGNGYAFLRLLARTGDELWLDRARAFAMHAAAQARAARRATGPRPPLFTGEAGVALFLAACLTGDARFPVLDEAP